MLPPSSEARQPIRFLRIASTLRRNDCIRQVTNFLNVPGVANKILVDCRNRRPALSAIFLMLSFGMFAQVPDTQGDPESYESKIGYFVFLMDSLNSALRPTVSEAPSAPERMTYLTPGLNAQNRMQGRILDEFTKVEVSDWTTYSTEDCGWPLGAIDKEWKAVEFHTRDSIHGNWKLAYRRILLRIEVCGGNRYLAVYEKNNSEPVIESFNAFTVGRQKAFQEEEEAIRFLRREMREAIPYPVEFGYSLSGNFYADRRNKILAQLSSMAYLEATTKDRLCGIWLDSQKNMVYFVGPNDSKCLIGLPLDYPSLFRAETPRDVLLGFENVKVNDAAIEFNYYGDMWTHTFRVYKVLPEQIEFSQNRTWARIRSTGDRRGSKYYEMLVAKQKKIEDDKKRMEADEVVRKERETLFFEKNKSRPDVITTPSGLQYEILRQTPKPKDRNKTAPISSFVRFEFTATTPAGNVLAKNSFDSPSETVNIGQIHLERLSGSWWHEALQLVPVGAIYRFYVPYDRATGSTPLFVCSKCVSHLRTTHLMFDIEMKYIKK